MKGVRTAALVGHLARRPRDAVVLARAGWRLRRDGWYRHSPFLPLPDNAYWHFRMVTVNGTSDTALSPASLVDAATWALSQPVGRS